MSKKPHKGKISKAVQKKEKKERLQELEKLYPKKKPYPNAGVTEVRSKGKKITDIRRGYAKKYTKGNFMYIAGSLGVQAYYMPSMKKRLKIMFVWDSKARKWKLETHREGDW